MAMRSWFFTSSFSFSGILIHMKSVLDQFAGFFVFAVFLVTPFFPCSAADTPPKPIPPPRVTLPDDLAKLNESIQAFIAATDAASRALGGDNSGSVGIDRQLLNPQLFQDIAALRAALKPVYAAQMEKLTEAIAAQQLISMSNSRLRPQDPTWTTYLQYSEQGFNVSPPIESKKALKPAIQSLTEIRKAIDNARVISRFVNEAIARADEAERRAFTFLNLLRQSNLLTINNLEVIYRYGGDVVVARPGEMPALLMMAAANTPPALLNTPFYQAATRIQPMIRIPASPDITDVPRFNTGLGGNGGWGTRFYSGFPGNVLPAQVSPGAYFTPVYVQPPLISNPAIPVRIP